MTPGLIG